jgi:hypothetical protein
LFGDEVEVPAQEGGKLLFGLSSDWDRAHLAHNFLRRQVLLSLKKELTFVFDIMGRAELGSKVFSVSSECDGFLLLFARLGGWQNLLQFPVL